MLPSYKLIQKKSIVSAYYCYNTFSSIVSHNQSLFDDFSKIFAFLHYKNNTINMEIILFVLDIVYKLIQS